MKQESLSRASIQELKSMYEEAASLHGRASVSGNHRAANAQYKRIATAWRELRGRGDEGRSTLTELIRSGNPAVRAWAASHVLEFAPELAEAELERLASGPPGVTRLDAELTLSEWRAGNLRFD
ncbi:DUF2019 domain-containing protein [Myxococcus llanfairpwllgwyngyllgogerychwyrndrobwllllantysiliogogogochensis]|uniref:DUF2019 domain-containing protein n=1 Tax=Myxococcus llanfairpwllgwyngyllgogerychwyrndrobwllllantysiliogogogochensis TaxID=2590453 RepID=A0A540WJY7_9BACT|nr:DUF2019 domain-containing protein [Myxococcus llanfairpwllgwyngyllgogerychwyrndrobwllllantysiliogogogochensis]